MQDLIYKRSSTLKMRLETTVAFPFSENTSVQSRTETWNNLLGAPDSDNLTKRAEWSDWSNEQIQHALHPSAESAIQALAETPAWLHCLREAFGDPAETTPQRYAEAFPQRAFNTEKPIPFEPIYAPLLAYAQNQVQQKMGAHYEILSNEAHQVLERNLLSRLSQICTQAIFTDFSVYKICAGQQSLFGFAGISTELYDRFINEFKNGRIWSFFKEYSVAARLCGTVTLLWIDTITEFILRLADDKEALEATFSATPLGKVVSLKANLSDPHGGGRSVMIPTFENGVTVVYKPRNIDLDAFFTQYQNWLNDKGISHPLRGLKTLSRSHYGWIEFAKHESCADEGAVERFYFRCGALLALAYSLNGSDFHFENLIANGEYPYLIDMEALLGHRFELEKAATKAGESQAQSDLFQHSVLRVGLLPSLKVLNNGIAINMGGIGGKEEITEPVPTVVWKDVNSDTMRLERKFAQKQEQSNNLAILNREATNENQYVGFIQQGFEQVYRILLTNRTKMWSENGLMQNLQNKRVRFIFRNTSLYATLLQRVNHPKYLRNGADRSIQLDVLCKPLLRLEERPSIWSIIEAERFAMEMMDVPLFETDSHSKDLHLDTGEIIENCFKKTAIEEAKERFAHFSEADLSWQLRHIAGTFAANGMRGLQEKMPHRKIENPIHRKTENVSDLVAAAEQIAGIMMEKAIELPNGELVFMDTFYLPTAQRYRYNILGMDYWSGTGGIAAFFASLGHHTKQQRYTDLAMNWVKPLCENTDDLINRAKSRRDVELGMGTGLASNILSLIQVYKFTREPSLLAAATQFGHAMDNIMFTKDQHFNWISGGVGGILGLLLLHNYTKDATFLDKALQGAHILIDKRTEHAEAKEKTWLTRLGKTELGFAHGLCGIAKALLDVHRATNDALCLEVANETLAQIAVRQHEFADDLSFATGLTGLAMAHLAHPTPDSALLNTIANQVKQHAANNPISDVSFASGFAGQSYFLRNMGYQAPLHALESLPEALGMMQGLAGVGFDLLERKKFN